MTEADKILHLSNICTAMGLIMKSGQNNFSPIKLALQPYYIKQDLYSSIGNISQVWQKLLYLASKDTDLIKKTFNQVAKIDEMISNLYKIYLKACELNNSNTFMFTRIDFFKDTDEQFKIIEYNLTSVSMASHSENFTRAKKLHEQSQKRDSKNNYPQNNPCSDISQAVSEIYKQKNLKGLFMMVVSSKEKNIVDQTCIEIKLAQKGVRTKRQNLCRLHQKIQVIENKLFYQNQEISMVYYRAGYQPSDYCESGQFNKCWAAREMIQLSSAIKIPDIRMQLMNQKRMQVELSKQKIHSKYLSEDQCRILRKSLVFTVDFQQNPDNIDFIKFIEQKGVDRFILKPNLQGGGNNIYGKNAYSMLKTLSQSERKKYILMEKIQTTPQQNTVFLGSNYTTQKCICEVSKYGILAQLDGKLIKNQCKGHLVRIKPQYADEGGVMAGVGAIAAIAYEN